MSSYFADDYSESIGKEAPLQIDFAMMLSMFGLIAIGLTSIYSATYDASMSKYFSKQLVFAGLGLVSMVSAIFVSDRWLRAIAPVLYAVSVVLLIAVLIPGIGMKINGQRCWINLGGFQFQPSELAKIATLLMVAKFMDEKGVNLRMLRDFLQLSGIVLLPLILVLLEKDTGTTSVFFSMLMGILLWGGAELYFLYIAAALPFVGISAMYGTIYSNKLPFFVITGLISAGLLAFRRFFVLSGIVIVLFLSLGFVITPFFNRMPEYQQARIKTFFEPEKYPKDEGYHVIQSMMAVGSGGLLGKGFLKGTQTQLRYIPEQWTDFIYCVPGEEFGFVGSVTVLGLLGFLILRIERVAKTVRNQFASTVCIGIASILLYHTIVNIGMAIGLFPVMGIPLPFLSSGGTALIANMTGIGLVLNFYRQFIRFRQTS